MMAGADSVETVLGPLSTSLSGLKLFMETIIDSEPWLTEPALIPMPWRDYDLPRDHRPLKIGVLWHDGIVQPHPPITRALKAIVERLKDTDIEVADFTPYLHDEAWAILSSLYYPDGGEADTEDMAKSGEPWRPLSEWIIKDNPCVKKLSVGELAYWYEEREAYRKEYALHWNKHGNDEDNRKLWDPEEFHGAPVGLQLVGRRFEDEKILGVLEHIQAKIGLPFC
jgi:Asp-tRNA(Asn)/Glu-tRNA(Gln) amidotransferase A subunit family amidase